MELTKGNFEELVFKKNGLTLVKFKTEWSGACQIISPLYFDLSRQYKGRVDFYFVDADQEKQLSEKIWSNGTSHDPVFPKRVDDRPRHGPYFTKCTCF